MDFPVINFIKITNKSPSLQINWLYYVKMSQQTNRKAFSSEAKTKYIKIFLNNHCKTTESIRTQFKIDPKVIQKQEKGYFNKKLKVVVNHDISFDTGFG